jgi:hypothetical protein
LQYNKIETDKDKIRTCSDFSIEKVRHAKIQSTFKEEIFKKRDIKDFQLDILQKSRTVTLKSAQMECA